MHQTHLIAIISAGLGLAFIFGLIANRLRLPLLVGYLAAGLVVGPFTPGFVADQGLATQLSEIGVSLLMFGVGLHFSIRDLLSVKNIAIPGALAQIGMATLLGLLVTRLWGWSLTAGIVFGLCLSVASTVVLLRALADRGEIETINGRIAVGWLIVEDLITVIALVAMPVVAQALQSGPDSNGQIIATLAITFLKVACFVGLMLIVGKRLIPRVLGRVARSGSKELFTVGVLAIALGVAFGSAALFGVSPALGAFFAGVILSESDLAYQAGAETRPVQDAFTVLFFVAIGMLFDPSVLLSHPWHLLAALSIVMVGKSLAALVIVMLFKFPVATALLISASLAQIGEFSFVLVAMGIQLKLMPPEALSIVVATAVLSIGLNPAVFQSLEPIKQFAQKNPRFAKMMRTRNRRAARLIDIDPDELQDHVVLVGFGGVGQTIAKALVAEHISFSVVEQNPDSFEIASKRGCQSVFGDASREEILKHAGVKNAKMLVLAIPANSATREIIRAARALNPRILVSVRTHDAAEAIDVKRIGVDRVVAAELELALELAHYVIESYDRSPERVDGTIDEVRKQELEAIALQSENPPLA
ncbi:MAG: cation:proton antiporter [Methanoregulaceae archaeon]|nr:cation:proton antiporter [Methanoregulaceae archaeon]